MIPIPIISSEQRIVQRKKSIRTQKTQQLILLLLMICLEVVWGCCDGPILVDNIDDPFADVSFHNHEGGNHADDIFTGMNVSEKQGATEGLLRTNTRAAELFDAFRSSPEVPSGQSVHIHGVADLIAGLLINKDASKTKNRKETSILEKYPANEVSNIAISNSFGPQAAGLGANGTSGNSSMPNNLLPLNYPFVPQPVNHGEMGNYFNQQQLLATIAHFQNLGNLSAQSVGSSPAAGSIGGYSSQVPDIFRSNFMNQAPTSTMNNLKKEDEKVFDFISDHLAAARDPKRVI